MKIVCFFSQILPHARVRSDFFIYFSVSLVSLTLSTELRNAPQNRSDFFRDELGPRQSNMALASFELLGEQRCRQTAFGAAKRRWKSLAALTLRTSATQNGQGPVSAASIFQCNSQQQRIYHVL